MLQNMIVFFHQENWWNIPHRKYTFLQVSGYFDSSPGELWVLHSKLLMSLFTMGILWNIIGIVPRGINEISMVDNAIMA